MCGKKLQVSVKRIVQELKVSGEQAASKRPPRKQENPVKNKGARFVRGAKMVGVLEALATRRVEGGVESSDGSRKRPLSVLEEEPPNKRVVPRRSVNFTVPIKKLAYVLNFFGIFLI